MDASSTTPNATPGKEPEKYIRTFAGDMDMVKKGGTSDLTPLESSRQPATGAVPGATLTGQAPLDAPVPPKTVTVHPPPVHTLVPPPAAPAQPPTIPPPAATPEIPKNPPLQTYSNDFSDRMKSMNASTATVLAAEQDRGPREIVPQESSHVRLPYVIGGAILLVAGITGGVVAYMQYTEVSAPVVIAPTVSAPIFVNEREEIAGTGEAPLQAITGSVSRPLASGTVRLLYVASTTGTENIFAALPVSAPDVLLRNINSTGNMVGVINVGGNQSPFFILSISSYSNVFFGMLSWEPLMPEYLAGLFPLNTSISEVSGESRPMDGIGSSTSPATAITMASTTPKSAPRVTAPKSTAKVASTTPVVPAFIAGFYDATVANRDVRVYRDISGRDVLLYGFWNQTTLIIARDAAAFTEIVGRLGTASTSR